MLQQLPRLIHWIALFWDVGWLGSAPGLSWVLICCMCVLPRAQGKGRGLRVRVRGLLVHAFLMVDPWSISIKPNHASTCKPLYIMSVSVPLTKQVTLPSSTLVRQGGILGLQWKMRLGVEQVFAEL